MIIICFLDIELEIVTTVRAMSQFKRLLGATTEVLKVAVQTPGTSHGHVETLFSCQNLTL